MNAQWRSRRYRKSGDEGGRQVIILGGRKKETKLSTELHTGRDFIDLQRLSGPRSAPSLGWNYNGAAAASTPFPFCPF